LILYKITPARKNNTSAESLRTTLIIFSKNYKGIPLQMLVTPLQVNRGV
jgi:hypothetical protein